METNKFVGGTFGFQAKCNWGPTLRFNNRCSGNGKTKWRQKMAGKLALKNGGKNVNFFILGFYPKARTLRNG